MLDCKANEKKESINALQMRFLRSLTGIALRDQIRSKEIRNQRKVEEMAAEIQQYWHKWRNHILRMSEHHLPKRLSYRPQGRRDLGGPHLCWTDQFLS